VALLLFVVYDVNVVAFDVIVVVAVVTDVVVCDVAVDCVGVGCAGVGCDIVVVVYVVAVIGVMLSLFLCCRPLYMCCHCYVGVVGVVVVCATIQCVATTG